MKTVGRVFIGIGIGVLTLIAAALLLGLILGLPPFRPCIAKRTLLIAAIFIATVAPFVFLRRSSPRRRSEDIALVCGYLIALYVPFVPCTLGLFFISRCLPA